MATTHKIVAHTVCDICQSEVTEIIVDASDCIVCTACYRTVSSQTTHWTHADLATLTYDAFLRAVIDEGICANCTILPITDGDKYCAGCTSDMLDALAKQYEEQQAIENGLY